jgi:hypothetical protein
MPTRTTEHTAHTKNGLHGTTAGSQQKKTSNTGTAWNNMAKADVAWNGKGWQQVPDRFYTDN